MDDSGSTFATPRVGAGALFITSGRRVLLVHPTYKDTWDIPGGYVERGESPATACRRELAEELELDRAPRRLVAVDWAPSDHEGDKILFIFDCGDLDDYLIPRLARRIHSAVDLGARSGAYLEHGRTVSGFAAP